jgi:hypothetical protein
MTLETRINALAYELGLSFSEKYPSLKFNVWFQRLMEHCKPFWVEWKTQRTMASVDQQINDLHQKWDQEEAEKQKPVFTEKEPNGSMAQSLLGGEMRLTAPWYQEDDSSS